MQTLKDMYDILLELAEPYRQSPQFEKVEEPLAAEDDSSMSVRIWFNDRILTITCDQEGFIENKTKKRKLTKQEDEKLNGHQMTLNELVQQEVPEKGPQTEAAPVPEKEAEVETEIPEETEPVPATPVKAKSSSKDSKTSYKIGEEVCLIYSSEKIYTVEAVMGATIRLKGKTTADTFCVTASDIKRAAD